MTIVTVHDNGNYYTVTLSSGTILYVPKDALNADYVHVQAWVVAGGIIA